MHAVLLSSKVVMKKLTLKKLKKKKNIKYVILPAITFHWVTLEKWKKTETLFF